MVNAINTPFELLQAPTDRTHSVKDWAMDESAWKKQFEKTFADDNSCESVKAGEWETSQSPAGTEASAHKKRAEPEISTSFSGLHTQIGNRQRWVSPFTVAPNPGKWGVKNALDVRLPPPHSSEMSLPINRFSEASIRPGHRVMAAKAMESLSEIHPLPEENVTVFIQDHQLSCWIRNTSATVEEKKKILTQLAGYCQKNGLTLSHLTWNGHEMYSLNSLGEGS